MQKEKYIIIPKEKDLNKYAKEGFNNFILPLKDYSIGFSIEYSIDEINILSSEYNVYVMINKFLHKKIKKFIQDYDKIKDNVHFIIEDIGLIEVIDNSKIILYEDHIQSNYTSVNYMKTMGISRVVLNNDLTIEEISEIKDKTNSELYFFIINRNTLLYSKRRLISNYQEFYKYPKIRSEYELKESVSNFNLMIEEYNDSTTIKNKKIFNGNKYLDTLTKLDYLIINLNGMSEVEEKLVLDNYNSENLINLIDSDYYFLENEIKYKVGESK